MNKCPIYATLNGVGSVRLQSPDSENSLFSPLYKEELLDLELSLVHSEELNLLISALEQIAYGAGAYGWQKDVAKKALRKINNE